MRSSVWEELGPLLDYVPEDGELQAVVAIRDLLRELYRDKPPRGDLRAAEVARVYRAHCCKEACQSNTSSTLKSMSPGPWPMHAAWGLGWVPCAWMLLTASTPSLGAHTMTTRAAGGGGCRGQPN